MTIEHELACAHEGALLLPTQHDALLVTGKDRVRWVNGMVTCDVAKIPVGGASYGLHVGKTGKVSAELWILVSEGDVLIASPLDRGAELAEALDKYLIMEDCVIAAAPGPWGSVLALGPDAATLAESARARGLRAGVGQRGGAPAALIGGRPDDVAGWADEAAAGGGRVARATPDGWERTRIELGIGTFGLDFDENAYPQEAALESDGVSFSKGCYLGQEAVFMMQERGHPPRRLVQLVIDNGDALAAGTPVLTPEGVAVGTVTSRVSRGDDVLALATVKWKVARAGTELTVEGRRAVVTPRLAIRG